jgi:D-alanyl-D-alanine carboxypeptidase
VRLRGTLVRLGRFVALGVLTAVLGSSLWAAPAEARYAAMVVDADTGEVLFSRNGQAIRYPASLTKMMTLYLAFEALDQGTLTLNKKLKVSKRAAGQTPSRLGLRAGSTITTRDAILAMVTKSANDAATVVAEAIGGTEVKFAEMMTAKARELGMRRTTFKNASGLPNRHQRTTARDMSLLATALLRNHADRYHYFSTTEFKYGGRTYSNHNRLLRTYEGADGIKTGYIRASGFNVVASVKRGDKRLIGIVFGGKSAKSRDSHARSLFDRAFSIIEARNIPRPAIKPRPPAVATPQLAADAPAEAPAPEQGSTSDDIHSVIPQGARIAAPPTPTIPGRSWLIQVGAFADKDAAFRGIRQASEVAARYLEDARVTVSEAPSRSGKALYRARIVGISRQNAFSACRALEKRRIDCVALNPTDG